MKELFETNPTRSNRAKWALEEIGAIYTSRPLNLQKGEHKAAEYLAVNPLGKVPTYRTDDYTIQESVAIVMQLIDENPEAGLAPKIGTPERAEYYQWCVFSVAEMDPTLSEIMMHTMYLPEDQKNAQIAEKAVENFAKQAAMLSNRLEGRKYLVGTTFSGADIAVGFSCNWAAYIGQLEKYPILATYYQGLTERPGFKKAFGK